MDRNKEKSNVQLYRFENKVIKREYEEKRNFVNTLGQVKIKKK